MILASVLLIVAAVALLAVGLIGGSNGYLVASIAASLLSAMALIVSGRQLPGSDQERVDSGRRGVVHRRGSSAGQSAGVTIPAQQDSTEREQATGRSRDASITVGGDLDSSGTVGEPAASALVSGDAVRPGRLTGEVYVIDGRPAYHLGGCSLLHGFERESLPIAEALELGFTPCDGCAPDSVLLDRSGRTG